MLPRFMSQEGLEMYELKLQLTKKLVKFIWKNLLSKTYQGKTKINIFVLVSEIYLQDHHFYNFKNLKNYQSHILSP